MTFLLILVKVGRKKKTRFKAFSFVSQNYLLLNETDATETDTRL